MSSRKNAREWARLRLLCCSGNDLVTLAPDVMALASALVPSSAGGLFLTSHEGEQYARFHEDCPASVEQICTQGGSLFEAPGEPNYRHLYRPGAPKVGQWLEPPRQFLNSNTYQVLFRGCGYRHALDTRLEVDGRRMGMLFLFRHDGRPFSESHGADLGRISMYLEHAQLASRPPLDEANRAVLKEAMAITRPDGRLLFIGGDAEALLGMIPLVHSSWPDRRCLPPVCMKLIDVLRDDARYPTQLPACRIPVPGGALEIRAQWLGAVAPDVRDNDVAAMVAEGLVGINLTLLTPMSLQIWRRLGELNLSPTQAEVAFWMATGGGREAARARMPISESVLRDCVKAIYDRLGCSSQEQLAAALRGPGLRH